MNDKLTHTGTRLGRELLLSSFCILTGYIWDMQISPSKWFDNYTHCFLVVVMSPLPSHKIDVHVFFIKTGPIIAWQ
jgi:hypothetical protein